MREVLRNRHVATIAVTLGLGGLAAGCGNEQDTDQQALHEFNLCPPHAYKAVQIPPRAEAQASAVTGALAMACFILRQPLPYGKLDKAENGGVTARFVRKTQSLLNPGHGRYITSVTAPSFQDILYDSSHRGHLSTKTLDGVSIQVKTGQKTLFSYELSQQDDGWHLRSSVLDKGGAQHRFNKQVDDTSDSKVRTLGNVATLTACFEQRDVDTSYFQPDYVGHHDILNNCMVDNIGTPKP